MTRLPSKYEHHAIFSQPFSRFMVDVAFAIHSKSETAEQLFIRLCDAAKFAQSESKSLGFGKDVVNAALFPVCVWADEQIMNAGWEGVSDVWPNTLLQKELFNTNLGGELFYEKLDALFGDTMIAHDVYALCLAQGFKGKYVFNLEMHELEVRREKAIRVSLLYTGLENPKAETFAQLEYFSKDPEPVPLDSKVFKPIAYTVILLFAVGLFLYFMLQNQATALLKVFA